MAWKMKKNIRGCHPLGIKENNKLLYNENRINKKTYYKVKWFIWAGNENE